jgi:hypothetical protein
LSDPFWEFELFIEARELDICENDSLVRSLVFIDFPSFSIGMAIAITDLMHFWVTDHDIESNTIGNFPFELITNIWISFFGFFLDFKSKTGFLFSRFEIFDEANTELVPISTVNRRLCIVHCWESCADFFPVCMFRIDDVLSFDLFCHSKVS